LEHLKSINQLLEEEPLPPLGLKSLVVLLVEPVGYELDVVMLVV
jgi:hypothetical protein